MYMHCVHLLISYTTQSLIVELYMVTITYYVPNLARNMKAEILRDIDTEQELQFIYYQ
jgi:hypothetical protein